MKRIVKVAAVVVSATWFAAGSAGAQSAGLADPQGSGPIISAVQWLQGTLLGTVATVVAVIALALICDGGPR
jgi:type IV secretion system protein VirB2